MRQSESIAQLAADLARAQGELKNATENAASNRNKYATLAQVRNCTAPILSKHGLSMMQGTTYDGTHFILTTRLLHKSGEWIEGTYPLPIDKNSQLMGSAMTYGRRYCWTSMLGIDDEAAQDDDGEATRPQPDLGSIKGEGPSRHASNTPYQHLEKEMLRNDNPPDLNLWWVQNKPARENTLNSEHRWGLFLSMIRWGLDRADDMTEQKEFWTSHKTELEELKKRNASEYGGLEMYKEKAKKRFLLTTLDAG